MRKRAVLCFRFMFLCASQNQWTMFQFGLFCIFLSGISSSARGTNAHAAHGYVRSSEKIAQIVADCRAYLGIMALSLWRNPNITNGSGEDIHCYYSFGMLWPSYCFCFVLCLPSLWVLDENRTVRICQKQCFVNDSSSVCTACGLA